MDETLVAHRVAKLNVFGRQPLVGRIGRRYGPHRLAPLTGHPRSTISKVLSRAGMSRLRTPTGRPGCRPYRPQTNGKAQRFIETLIGEWACGTFYRSNHERLAAHPRWLRFYNHDRPHVALDGRSPMTGLVDNVRGNHI